MKDFWKGLLSADSGTSSKRFAGLCLIAMAALIAVVCIVGMFMQLHLDESLIEYIITALLTSGTTLLGLTIVTKK